MRPFLYRFSLIAGAKATGDNDTCIFECQLGDVFTQGVPPAFTIHDERTLTGRSPCLRFSQLV